MRFLRQSTSVDLPIGPFLGTGDGYTPATSLTLTQPDIRLKKGAAAWAQKNASQTLSHEENGYYEVTLDATDTDTLGLLRLSVTETGALPVWEEFMIMPAQVWDSLFGADVLQVDVAQFGGANLTATGGRPEVNTSHWAGTAVASAVILAAANIASDAFSAAKFAANCLTSAKFASGAFDAVWSVAARLLTAGTNIVLAKGTGVTGFNDLSAADVRTAVGLASANLDTQLGDLPTNAELATSQAAADDATLAAIAALNNLSSAQAQTAAAAALTAYDPPTNTEMEARTLPAANYATAANLATVAGYIDTEVAAIISTLAALNNISQADVLSQVQAALTATIADSVPADGTRPSISSGIYMLVQFMLERSVAGTTCTVRKPDGSSTLFTLTLNDATSPTSITRAA